MKRFLLPIFTIALLLPFHSAFPQIFKPVKWHFSSEPVKGKPGQYKLFFDATIDDGWDIYSQINECGDSGPTPTAIRFDDSLQIRFMAKSEESGGKMKHEVDKSFNCPVKVFFNYARFTQTICVVNDKKPVKGFVEGMSCSDRCVQLEPTHFEFNLKAGDCSSGTSVTPPANKDTSKAVASIPPVDTGKKQPATAMADDRPVLSAAPNGSCISKDLILDNLHLKTASEKVPDTLFTIFILGFLGGLVALLTPCVFPMIPLTVSFFTKGHKGRKGVFNAMLYAFFIFLIYFLLSLPFHLISDLDPNILNTISTNVYLNVFFFLIFVAFAVSFFGYYDIALPGSLSTKIDRASDVGGTLGIFFMALTLAIVSFSCTGPILGTLLGLTAQKGGNFAGQLTAGMSGFGLALALPFGLFAAFPGWLDSLPKSGGWLNTVKVVIGFVELALSLKFLSNADQVEHWGLLKREIFIGLWIILGVATVLYLFGFYKFPHDSPVKKLGKGRVTAALLILIFTAYLVPGMTNTPAANLSIISGFPPPLYYSIYNKVADPKQLDNHKNNLCAAMEQARKEHKPVMIDFTGFACVNCRRMEENVWTDAAVYDKLKQDYILVSLYVDDREPLRAEDQITVANNGSPKKLLTVGNKWGTFQTLNFLNNSQPYYALISPEGHLLTDPVGYTPDKQQYIGFLEKGVAAFKSLEVK